MARYYIETYGCTSNHGETQAIERRLRDAGHRKTNLETADVAILNTCTVVETTEDRMRRRATELAEATADLIVTGCMALAQPEEFGDLEARVRHWDAVPGAVGNGECPTTTDGTDPVLDGVIGILPIARGCMSNCSYCITKEATGRIESPPVEANVRRARSLIHAGAKELRITGQDTGVYGWDRNQGESLLPELLDRICTEIDGEFRVRVGMANPRGVYDVREELASVFAAHEKLYNFLHVPVQSGSNAVLDDMRRSHGVEEYRGVVETFDEYLPYWTLSTDFLVGFPTETEADHDKSVALLEETRPEKVNVTRFSKRPGTDAADLHGLGGQVKKDRSKELSERKRDLVASAYADMVGDRQRVLVVQPGREDSVKCRDGAYRQIIVREADVHGLEPGMFTTVKVTDSEHMYAYGRPVEDLESPLEAAMEGPAPGHSD